MNIYMLRRIGLALMLAAALGWATLWGISNPSEPTVVFTFWSCPLIWLAGGWLLQARTPPRIDGEGEDYE